MPNMLAHFDAERKRRILEDYEALQNRPCVVESERCRAVEKKPGDGMGYLLSWQLHEERKVRCQ